MKDPMQLADRSAFLASFVKFEQERLKLKMGQPHFRSQLLSRVPHLRAVAISGLRAQLA
jgi:hypothetical protein